MHKLQRTKLYQDFMSKAFYADLLKFMKLLNLSYDNIKIRLLLANQLSTDIKVTHKIHL